MILAFMLSLLLFDPAQDSKPFEVTKINCSNGLSQDNSGWSVVPTGLAQNRWTMEFRMGNLSDKQISAVHWAFRFKDKNNKVVIQEFKSKRSIKPGKDAIFREYFIFEQAMMPSPIVGTILLRQIDFADGSTWLPDPKDPDSGTVLVKP